MDHTPGSDVAAAIVAVRDDLVGTARTPIATNALGSLAVAGVYRRHWASADGRTTFGGPAAERVGTAFLRQTFDMIQGSRYNS